MVKSLRTRFILLFLVLFSIPFGLVAFISIFMSKGMMTQSTISHLRNLVDVKEVAIEQWLRERVGDGKTLSESQEIKSLDPKRIEPYVRLVKNFYQAYRDISVFNLKGKRIPGSGKASSENEEWFRGAVEKGVFVSKPGLGPPLFQPTLTISAVIRDDTGRPVGVLRELVDMAYVFELISQVELGKTGELYLVDRDGNFILHKGLRELLRKGLSRVQYFKNSQVEPARTATYRDYRGNEVLGSWRWIPGLQCYLVAEQDAKEAFYQTNLLVQRALAVFVLSGLFIIGISYWAFGSVTRPIERLGKTVASFAAGRFDKTPDADRRDEIGKLVEGFNIMAERLKKAYAELEGKVRASNSELEKAYQTLKQRQEQLVRSEKMAALGQLSAGIAHEIRNPLTSVKIFIQSLEKEIDLDENQKEDFTIIKREIDRINEHITRFLDFARPEEPRFQPVPVHALVMDTLSLLAPRMRSTSVDLDVSLPEDLPPVEGDPKQLGQVFLNLILNAVEAMPKGGKLTIQSTLKAVPEDQETWIQLFFQDTGCGIPEGDRPYLYDPFFTTKERGTGLGLSIVYSIVQKHNGQIEVESEPGKGSLFIVTLPVWKGKPWEKSSSSMTT